MVYNDRRSVRGIVSLALRRLVGRPTCRDLRRPVHRHLHPAIRRVVRRPILCHDMLYFIQRSVFFLFLYICHICIQ